MTKKLAHKLLALLIDPDVSDADFKQFTYWLEKGGIEKVILLAQQIRKELEINTSHQSKVNGPNRTKSPKIVKVSNTNNVQADINSNTNLVFGKPVPEKGLAVSTHPSNSDDKVFKETYRLLIKESKLKKSEALKMIANNIGYNLVLSEGISFREGIRRFVEFSGESKVLHVAQSIKNKLLNSIVSEWPLEQK